MCDQSKELFSCQDLDEKINDQNEIEANKENESRNPTNLPSDLLIEQIRWFYREPDKYWQPFNGADSINLEFEWRIFSDNTLITVRGGLYEVDLINRVLIPIYWDSSLTKSTIISRGTWFEVSGENWYPFEEKDSVLIENFHCNIYLNDDRISIIHDKKTASKGLFELKLADSNIIWYSLLDIRRTKIDFTSKIFGLKGNPIKRGYKVNACKTDDLPPIGHLIFVIHGIGQAMESASIVKTTDCVREISKTLSEKYFPNKLKHSRVEFLPINWRSWLTLDKGFISKLSLENLKSVRNMLHLSVGDILYYTSSRYGPEMIDGLYLQMTLLYNKFEQRNPNYVNEGGKFSIMAHSLGSVLMYDVLQSCKFFMNCNLCENERQKCQTELIELEKRKQHLLLKLNSNSNPKDFQINMSNTNYSLKFNIEHFFSIGSPLSVFISLRDVPCLNDSKPKSIQNLFPYVLCKRFYNIFHPADPISHRIEPLLSSAYFNVKPILIESASYKPTEDFTRLAMGPYIVNLPFPNTHSTVSKLYSYFKTTSNAASNITQNSISVNESDEIKTSFIKQFVHENDAKLHFNERLLERYDFVLKERMLENSHLNLLTAHTCYWESKDTILFILLQIYSFVPKPVV